jgi:hypothetical protein
MWSRDVFTAATVCCELHSFWWLGSVADPTLTAMLAHLIDATDRGSQLIASCIMHFGSGCFLLVGHLGYGHAHVKVSTKEIALLLFAVKISVFLK